MKYNYVAIWLIMVSFLSIGIVQSQVVMENTPELQKIDVIEHYGEQIPLDLSFINANNEAVRLQSFFGSGKPVLITLAYYECPMLCTFVLNGISKAVGEVAFAPGKDYQIITISIDPTETAVLAEGKKKNQVAATGKMIDNNGWEFLVGEQPDIEKLADALGFKYYYDEERDEYAHPAVSFILTEQGIISRYLYGFEHKEQDLRFALMEASQGKIGNTLDKILLFCYHYDPDAKGYVVFAGNVMRAGGVITVLIIGTVLIFFWRRELKHKIKMS
jgi:protein SCO1/2